MVGNVSIIYSLEKLLILQWTEAQMIEKHAVNFFRLARTSSTFKTGISAMLSITLSG